MRSEEASTTLRAEPARFVWMMGCVLQDACDNMRAILIFKLKLRVNRRIGAARGTSRMAFSERTRVLERSDDGCERFGS